MKSPKSFRDVARQFPPFVVYYYARLGRPGRPLGKKCFDATRRRPVSEMVAKSGIPERTFFKITRMFSFETVTFDVADRFVRGCGVDLDARRFRQWMTGLANGTIKLSHLMPSQRTRFARLAVSAKGFLPRSGSLSGKRPNDGVNTFCDTPQNASLSPAP